MYLVKQKPLLVIFSIGISGRVLRISGGITMGSVWVKARSLVASIELVEPDAFEEVVVDCGERGRLVEAAELHVGVHTRRHVEHVDRGVWPIWLREEGIARGGRREPGFDER